MKMATSWKRILSLASCLTLAVASAVGQQSRPSITGISHISVYTSDAGKAESFYQHDLGGVKRADPENSDGSRYYFSPIQFVEVLPLPAGYTSINRLDHVAFNTSNAEGLKKYLGEHGITGP